MASLSFRSSLFTGFVALACVAATGCTTSPKQLDAFGLFSQRSSSAEPSAGPSEAAASAAGPAAVAGAPAGGHRAQFASTSGGNRAANRPVSRSGRSCFS